MTTEQNAANSTAVSDRILYLDDCVAVVNKRIGEICETETDDPALSLVENVRAELESRAGRKLPDLEAVHRIDQPVSGAVLLALDKKSLQALSAAFAAGRIRKRYLAIVERPSGAEFPPEGRLEHMLRFDAKHHKATALRAEEIRKNGPDWKRVALSWKLAGNGDRYAFLEVIPETGRTHQIRAQLAAAGMTIKGDLKYGARRSDPRGGIRLHAYEIQFPHPVSLEAILVRAPVVDPDPLWRAFLQAYE